MLPYLTEHEGPNRNEERDEGEYNPSPEEKKLVKRIQNMLQKSKAVRAAYDQHWPERYKMFRGKQWTYPRPSYRNSEVFNLIFQIIQSQVPILTDARPKIEYMPQEPSDREFAELMNDIVANDWETGNYQYNLAGMLYDSKIYGTALSWLGYDPDAENGLGRICFRPEEIQWIFPDPDGCDEGDGIQDCDYFIKAQPVNVRKLKRKYPKHAKKIKGDTESLANYDKNDLMPTRALSPASDRITYETSGSTRYPDKEAKVLQITAYYRDSEIVEEEKPGEDGASYVEQRLKFPKGRKTVIANGCILEDGPNDYDDGQWPWQKLVNYIAPHEFYGISELEPIEGPQRIFNKLVSFVLDVLHLTGNPVWIVDNNSGIDTDNLTNAPGLIVEKNAGSEVRRESGVQLQPYVLSLINSVKEWVDQIAGSQDITRGIPTGGVTAASAIADLQNAAQTRIRQQSRNLDAFLNDFGEQYASRVMQFYNAPRIFRLTNKDGTQKYFRAQITKNEDGSHRALVQRFNEDSGLPSERIDEYQLKGKLDLRVTTGTSLPFSKAQTEQRLLNLYDREVIDDEELLKGIDYPNWEAVLERKRQKQAAAAQAAAQQQGQGQQPAAPAA